MLMINSEFIYLRGFSRYTLLNIRCMLQLRDLKKNSVTLKSEKGHSPQDVMDRFENNCGGT